MHAASALAPATTPTPQAGGFPATDRETAPTPSAADAGDLSPESSGVTVAADTRTRLPDGAPHYTIAPIAPRNLIRNALIDEMIADGTLGTVAFDPGPTIMPRAAKCRVTVKHIKLAHPVGRMARAIITEMAQRGCVERLRLRAHDFTNHEIDAHFTEALRIARAYDPKAFYVGSLP